MVSSGKGDIGAVKLTAEVMDIMNRLPLLVQNMTGVDISKVTYNDDKMSGLSWDHEVASQYKLLTKEIFHPFFKIKP